MLKRVSVGHLKSDYISVHLGIKKNVVNAVNLTELVLSSNTVSPMFPSLLVYIYLHSRRLAKLYNVR